MAAWSNPGSGREHGDYPANEIGQKKYPRYEFFKQAAEVFARDGRSVPVFNDKHLSWKWEWAKEMVDTAKKLKELVAKRKALPTVSVNGHASTNGHVSSNGHASANGHAKPPATGVTISLPSVLVEPLFSL